MPRHRAAHIWDDYHVRVLGCMAASLAIVIAVFELWPPQRADSTREARTFHALGQDVIELEDVQQTRQGQERPPPPVPAVPVVVPNELQLEDVDLDLSDNFLALEAPGDGAPGVPQGAAAGDEAAAGPVRADVGPRTVRFVEPEYTREARRRAIKAELVVEVLVDEQGRVVQTEILERFLLGESRRDRRPVAELGYGLEEAALAAAARWLFRPARHGGEPVRSYTTLTFTFGV